MRIQTQVSFLAAFLIVPTVIACGARLNPATATSHGAPDNCLVARDAQACLQCGRLLSHLFETHLYAAESATASPRGFDLLVRKATCVGAATDIIRESRWVSEPELNERWINRTKMFLGPDAADDWPKTVATCFDLSDLPFQTYLRKHLALLEVKYDIRCGEIENSMRSKDDR